MAEKSMFWPAPTFGDGSATYTADEMFSFFGRMFLYELPGGTYEDAGGLFFGGGVIAHFLDELLVTPGASKVTVAPGAAIIQGIPYINTTNKELLITTPTLGTTAFFVVLRATYASQTVRLAILRAPNGDSNPPALTTTAGSVWEIPIVFGSISIGGVVLVEPVGNFAHFNTKVNGKMLDNTSVDDAHIRFRVPKLAKRQGGDGTNWNTQGTANFDLTGVKMQAGSFEWTGGAVASGSFTITFPQTYSFDPLFFVNGRSNNGNVHIEGVAQAGGATATVFWKTLDGTTRTSIGVSWMAIGTG